MTGKLGFFSVSLIILFFCTNVLAKQITNDANTKLSRLDKILRIDMLHKIAAQNMDRDTLLSIGYLKEALKISEEIAYPYGEAMSYFLLGKVHGSKMLDLKKGIDFHKKSIAIVEKLDSLDLLAKNYFHIGLLYYALGHHSTALNNFMISLDHYEKTGDSLHSAFVQVGIGAIYAEWSTDSYTLAMKYYGNALRKAEEFKSDELFVYTIFFYSTSLLLHGEYEKAEGPLRKAISLAENNPAFKDVIPRFYANWGEILLSKKDSKAAIQYFEKSKEFSEKNHVKYGMADAFLKLGRAYQHSGQQAKAEQYHLRALKIYLDVNMRKRIIEVYDGLAGIAKANHNYEQAFQFKSLQLAYEDSIREDQRNNLLHEMHANIDKIEKEKQLEIQRKDEHINDLYMDNLIIVLLALSLIVLLYFNRQRLRAAKDKAVLSKEKLLLQKELENIRLGEEQLKQQLEFNAKTLTANTLNLIQKNEILEKIKTKAEEIKKASATDLPAKINNLMHTVNFALNIDKDWENFKIHFEQVHNNFFENLKIRYPDLNSNDLRLCALLKLNLDTKEIATIMDISPESVKVARSRLRKKLQLDPSNNLSSFITQV